MSTRGWERATVQDTRDRRRPSKPVRSKYKAVRTVVHGIEFHSKAEARRYQELLLRGTMGEIRNLELQPRFYLHANGVRVGSYFADFAYDDGAGRVIEDVKSQPTKTAIYRWKKKHVEAEYGIRIKEV
jgi:hypothetical protein